MSNFALNVRVYKDVAKANVTFFETRSRSGLALATLVKQKKSQAIQACDDVAGRGESLYFTGFSLTFYYTFIILLLPIKLNLYIHWYVIAYLL